MVGSGVVTDSAKRRQLQVDAAVVEPGSGGRRPSVGLLGEAKWGTVLGVGHLERLDRARRLLGRRGFDTSSCVPAFFGAAGFSDALRAKAEEGCVLLVGLDELYGRAMPVGFAP